VEFGVALPVLILLLFGVIEFGRLLQSWVTIQHAVEEGARFATTGAGYGQGSGVRETLIVSNTLVAAKGIAIDAAAGQSDPSYFDVNIRSSRSGPDPMEADNAGQANDFIQVTVTYNHPVLAPVFGDSMRFISLRASSVVMAEHFARPTGMVGELPPTPVATWTPTPAPTATRTPTPGP
jgi:Flp pilus assembly protein TadG